MFKRQSEARTTIQPPSGVPRGRPGKGEFKPNSGSADKPTMNITALDNAITPLPARPAPAPPVDARATVVSDALAVYDGIQDTFNLTGPGRDIFGGYAQLQETQKAGFLNQLASLLHQGVVGTETREVDGRPYQSFVEIGFADERLRGTRSYTRGSQFDLRA